MRNLQSLVCRLGAQPLAGKLRAAFVATPVTLRTLKFLTQRLDIHSGIVYFFCKSCENQAGLPLGMGLMHGERRSGCKQTSTTREIDTRLTLV